MTEEQLSIKTSKSFAFQILFEPNDQGVSNVVSRDVLDQTALAFTNNGNIRNGVPQHWPSDIKNKYVFQYTRLNNKPSGRIETVQTIGFQEEHDAERPIAPRIREHYKEKSCVVCGISTNIVMDHKNDLYNDPRVLDPSTQMVDDFQPLCNGCNLKKRQISIKTIEQNRRIGATYMPQLSYLGVDFIQGDETFDRNDPNAMVGTYWYDPIEFMRKATDIFCERRMAVMLQPNNPINLP